MILTKQVYRQLKQASYAEMLGFITQVYKQGFIDGANSDVDPDIHYIAIKKGTEYICGYCGAVLEFEEEHKAGDCNE